MTAAEIADKIEQYLLENFPTRLIWPQQFHLSKFNEERGTSFGSPEDVEAALWVLHGRKVLQRQIKVVCGNGHSLWVGINHDVEVGNEDSEEEFLAAVLIEEGAEYDGSHQVDCWDCGGGGVDEAYDDPWPFEGAEDGEVHHLEDLTLAVDHWGITKEFEARVEAGRDQERLISHHVDRGRPSWEVAVCLKGLMSADEVESVIERMLKKGSLLKDKESHYLYVTAWYPKTIARVRKANEAFDKKSLI